MLLDELKGRFCIIFFFHFTFVETSAYIIEIVTFGAPTFFIKILIYYLKEYTAWLRVLMSACVCVCGCVCVRVHACLWRYFSGLFGTNGSRFRFQIRFPQFQSKKNHTKLNFHLKGFLLQNSEHPRTLVFRKFHNILQV